MKTSVNWDSDTWQVRLSADCHVEFVQNGRAFYTSKQKPSFPLMARVDFSSDGHGHNGDVDSAIWIIPKVLNQSQSLWTCKRGVNWISGMAYSQRVVDSVRTKHVTSYDDAIAKVCPGIVITVAAL